MATTNATRQQNDSEAHDSSAFVGVDINIVARVIFIIVGSLEVLSGVVGNILLLTVVLRRRSLRMRCVHNFFLASLALADLVSLGYWMTFYVLDLCLGYHPVVNETHCRANGFIIGVVYLAGTLSLLSISFNRYLHVCHSHLYSCFFSWRRTFIWCGFLWLFSAVVALPPLVGVGSYSYSHANHFCSFSRTDPNKYAKVMVIVFSVIPFCFVGYCNLAIFRFWRQARIRVKVNYPLLQQGKESAVNVSKLKSLLSIKRHKAEPLKPADNGQGEVSDGCVDLGTNEERTDSDNSAGVRQDGKGGVPVTDPGAKRNAPEETTGNCNTTVDTQETSCYRETDAATKVIDNGTPPKQEPENAERAGNRQEHILVVSGLSTTSQSKEHPVNGPGLMVGTQLQSASLSRYRKRVNPSEPSTPLTPPRSHLQQLQRRQEKRRSKEEAFVRSLFIVFLLIVFAFIPYGVTVLVGFFTSVPPEVSMSMDLVLFFNNAVNWIVYGVMNPTFRRGYKNSLKRLFSVCRCSTAGPQNLNASLSSQGPMTISSLRVNGLVERSETSQDLQSL